MKKLIEKFLMEELNEEEASDFLYCTESDNLAEKAYVMMMLKEIFAENDANGFRQILKEIEVESQFKESYEMTYLQKYFKPVEAYENQLKNMPLPSMEVLSSKNNINSTQTLLLEFKKELTIPLLLFIEDNDCKECLCTEIPSHTVFFEVDLLKLKNFHPGRFYWKLTTQSQKLLTMGVFFIGKGLII